MCKMYDTYCHASTKLCNFTPETHLSITFLLSCIHRMLNYDLKSQQMVLHANLHSEMVLTIFSSLFGGNHIRQLIIL